MPFPVVAAIAGAASVAGNVLNNAATGKANDKTIQLYAQQRKDSLADWHMQNDYNTPQAQMQRLKEAGLNPNLVYGNGADVTSGPVRSSSPGGITPSHYDLDKGASSAIGAYLDSKLQAQQINNLQATNSLTKEQTELALSNRINTEADTINKLEIPGRTKAETESILQRLRQEAGLFSGQLEFQKGQIRQQDAQTTSILDENDRRSASNAVSIQNGLEDIIQKKLSQARTEQETKNLKQALANLNQDSELKELDLKLKRNGVQPGDNLIIRAIAQKWDEIKKFINSESGKSGNYDWKKH